MASFIGRYQFLSLMGAMISLYWLLVFYTSKEYIPISSYRAPTGWKDSESSRIWSNSSWVSWRLPPAAFSRRYFSLRVPGITKISSPIDVKFHELAMSTFFLIFVRVKDNCSFLSYLEQVAKQETPVRLERLSSQQQPWCYQRVQGSCKSFRLGNEEWFCGSHRRQTHQNVWCYQRGNHDPMANRRQRRHQALGMSSTHHSFQCPMSMGCVDHVNNLQSHTTDPINYRLPVFDLNSSNGMHGMCTTKRLCRAFR